MKIFLMGRLYHIKIVGTDPELEPRLVGRIDYRSNQITIDKNSTSMLEVLFHEIAHLYFKPLRENLPDTLEGLCDFYAFIMEDIYYHNGPDIFVKIHDFLSSDVE